MNLDPRDLEKIAAGTLEHYNGRAEQFWEGTRDHDVTQNISALLRHITGPAPYTILDLGCGPGRDLKTFTSMGHVAIGVEGASKLAAMALEHSGCEVLEQDFLKLNLPPARFDGVFANAALFHVPAQELPRVLGELRTALHDLETWRRFVTAAGFTQLEHYYQPQGLPREQQPWLATVWRR